MENSPDDFDPDFDFVVCELCGCHGYECDFDNEHNGLLICPDCVAAFGGME